MCSNGTTEAAEAMQTQPDVDVEDTVPPDNRGVSHLTTTDLFRHCDREKTEQFVIGLIDMIKTGKIKLDDDKKSWTKGVHILTRLHHITPGISQLNYAYKSLVGRGLIEKNEDFETLSVAKQIRSVQGVNVVTVLTSPYPLGQMFSCHFNCSFCPTYPNMPKSYIPDEPAVLRGNRNDWDPVKQVDDRLCALCLNGCEVCKVELLVLGGTWDSYPIKYQEEFCRDLYYALNTFMDDQKRDRLSLEEEMLINQTARIRMIGLTLETRPDQINSENIIRYRKYGCTRIQLGVQHLDDEILRKNNRECYQDDTRRAIWNLLNSGYKIDGHLMPDLPGSSPEKDKEMFNEILYNPDFRFDQLKIYPCETTPHTLIQKWMESGQYEHYNEEDLMNIIMDFMANLPEHIRVNRVVRDIPTHQIIDGIAKPNLLQILNQKMAKMGLKCKCIRCREVGTQKDALAMAKDAELVVRQYNASGGTEYFISFESPDRAYIYGFCRLRLSPDAGYCKDIPCPRDRKKSDVEKLVVTTDSLRNTAMIRELHVYGKVTPVGAEKKTGVQHYGFGKRMMAEAERIAVEAGYTRISVISGIGVREFYQKLGYVERDSYMMKNIGSGSTITNIISKSYNTLLNALRKM
uniref:tRNA carboxymethyluridine synthase n=1 Tax=viral metagenome TaxID=1070528 RepID=A0A6C0E8Q7_9ZZZZ